MEGEPMLPGPQESKYLPGISSPGVWRAFSSSFPILVGPWYPKLLRVSEVSPLVAISEFRIIPCFWEQKQAHRSAC